MFQFNTLNIGGLGNGVSGLAVATVLRVAELTSKSGGRTFTLAEQQGYHDFVAVEAIDPLQHPSLGTATHTAVKSGDWSDPTLWSTGTLPGDNAIVNVSTFTVTYDVSSTAKIAGIHVSGAGTLKWSTTVDTLLWVDTVICHGTLIMGDVVAPIPESATLGKAKAEVVFWASQAPGATVRLGLNTMGPVRIHGSPKAHALQSNTSIPVGATSVDLSDIPTANWRVGDTIMFVATEASGNNSTDPQYSGPTTVYVPGGNGGSTQTLGFKKSGDELRVIAGISGTTVSWATPLLYAHNVYSDTLPDGRTVTVRPVVASLSRSILFRSADSSDTVWVGDLTNLQKRAHMMFMFSDDVQVRYAEAKNMARTDTNPSLADPGGTIRYATTGTTQPITDANNVRGRYAFHFHGTGAYNWRKMTVLEGCSAWAPTSAPPMPGWAITQHNSRCAFEKNVGYNARGALMVSEKGNEIGQWISNVMCWARGDGFVYANFDTRAELWENHNGHGGIAYENQARQILQHGNVASSSHHAWFYLQQDVNQLVRIPDDNSLRLRDPIAQGGATQQYGDDNTYGVEQAQIPYFKDNIHFDCDNGFGVGHRSQFIDRNDSTPLIADGFHGINSGADFALINYSYAYNFTNSLWWGRTGQGAGAVMGPVSWQFNFSNIKIKNKSAGFVNTGVEANYAGFIVDVAFENVTTPLPIGTATVADAATTMATHPYRDFMGPWTQLSTTLIKIRDWNVLNHATDLPQPYPLAPLGKNLGTGYPAVPYGGDPYFVLDAGCDLSVPPTGVQQFSISGVIRDCVGDRRYPDHQNPESEMGNLSVKDARHGYFMTGTDMVKRNGCFQEGGVWKSRLWFLDADRATNKELAFYVDMTLEAGFDVNFLAANTVDPMATKPTLFIAPEQLRADVVTAETSKPIITSDAATQAVNGQPLLYRLRANKGQGKWAIGGVDAASFEIYNTFYLRFAGNASKAVGAPDDVGADGVYDITVTFTDQFGNASDPQSLSVTLQSFFDDFVGLAGDPIDTRYGWTHYSGQATAMKLDGSGFLARVPTGAAQFVRSLALPSYDQTVEVKLGITSRCFAILRFTDASNWVGIVHDSSPNSIKIQQMKAGVMTELARYSPATTSDLLRLTLTGNTFQFKKNGVLASTITGGPTASGLTTITMADPVANSYNCGLYGQAGGGTGAWLGSIRFI